MINNCPLSFKNKILNFFNIVWSSGNIPKQFKHAVVVPIPKPGKDLTDPLSYRPISLTSQLGKLLETVVNKRLTHHLEANNLISETQAGFRQNRQTLDQLVALENEIKAGKTNNKTVGAVFLDLEKAYDTMWREGLLKKLKELGIRGHMYNYIASFLRDRTFQVKVGSALSSVHQLQNGTPQGAVISPTLFNIAVNNLKEAIDDRNMKISQFADDCAIWKTWAKFKPNPSKIDKTVEQKFLGQLEKQTNNLIQHLREAGLKVNTKKTQAILFNTSAERTLNIDKTEIKTQPTAKFLGITFEKQGKYRQHIQEVSRRASMGLALLIILSRKGMHVPYSTKKVIYRSLVEARLTYGQEIYMQTDKTDLNKLDKIQASALRLLTNSIKSCNIAAMQVATNIEPLEIRRNIALLRFQARCSLNKNNPTRDLFRDPMSQTSATRLAKTNRKHNSATWTAHRLTEELELDMGEMITPEYPPAPWMLDEIEVDTSLSQTISKKRDLPADMKTKALEHIEKHYREHRKVYTDGSRKEETVGIGLFSSDLSIIKNKRITNNCSITTAELTAIKTTLETIKKMETEDQNIVILTDSLSAAQMIAEPNTKHSRNDITTNILQLHQEIKKELATTIKICWIPAHCDIEGNERADAAAKQGLDRDKGKIKKIGLGKTEIYALITQKVRQVWQRQWDNTKSGTIFKQIVPKIGKNKLKFDANNRKINRLRLNGPIFKIGKEMCHNCAIPTTTEHILLHCPAYDTERAVLTSAMNKHNIPITTTEILSLNVPRDVETAAKALINKVKEKI